jgi:hypothetical protein
MHIIGTHSQCMPIVLFPPAHCLHLGRAPSLSRYGVAAGGVTWTNYAPAHVFLEWRLGISKSRADALDVDAQPQPPNRELARNEVLPLCQEGLVVAVHVVAARVLRIRDWQPIAK